jgi:hypothetical protein
MEPYVINTPGPKVFKIWWNHTEKGHFSKRGLNILWIKIDPLDQYTMGFIISHYTGISLE